MSGASLIFLLNFVAQTCANTPPDKSIDRFVNTLFDKLLFRTLRVSPFHHTELDKTTLKKLGHIPIPSCDDSPCIARRLALMDTLRASLHKRLHVFMEQSHLTEKEELSNQTRLKAAKVTNSTYKLHILDMEALRRQVLHYLGDKRLCSLSKACPEGWHDLQVILNRSKIQDMKASKEDVLEVLKDSDVEIIDQKNSACCLRLKDMSYALKALKTINQIQSLSAKALIVKENLQSAIQKIDSQTPRFVSKQDIDAHLGGVVALVEYNPLHQTLAEVKKALKAKLPEKAAMMVARHADFTWGPTCVFACTPFAGDLQLLKGLELVVGNHTLKTEIPYGTHLWKALQTLPPRVKDLRRAMQLTRQRDELKGVTLCAVQLGNETFENFDAVRRRIQIIFSSHPEDEVLDKKGPDFEFLHALLKYHPKYQEKLSNLTDIKVTAASGLSHCNARRLKTIGDSSHCLGIIIPGTSYDHFVLDEMDCKDALDALAIRCADVLPDHEIPEVYDPHDSLGKFNYDLEGVYTRREV